MNKTTCTGIFIYLFSLLVPLIAFSQQLDITGSVVDAKSNSPLAGVSISVKGKPVSAQTDSKGTFMLAGLSPTDVLVFSFVGYFPREIAVNQQDPPLVIQLTSSTENLDEVVVTAFGVSRAKKALGYAVQDVNAQELATRPANALGAISGKVAGLQVIPSGGNLGGSTRVLLRGINSISGNNQPLYIIDGTPIDNTDLNSSSMINGSAGKDFGNLIQDLNPDDIANISVLKGPSAAALYGSRAANGVILITTKKGEGADKFNITFNTGIELENIVRLPKRQHLYGQGYTNSFATATINGQTYNIVNYEADESWGPKLDGTPVLHWYNLDPEYPADYLNPQPWEYPEHDVSYFFRTGVSNTNNLAISGSSGNTAYRLSYTNRNVRGTTPNSSLGRNTLNFAGSTQFGRLKVSSNLSYTHNNTLGRPWAGASNRNIILEAFQWGGVQVDYKRLAEYKRPDGTPRAWNRTGYQDTPAAEATRFIDNPYWSAYESYLEEKRDRLYGNIGLTLQATDWLDLSGRVHGDVYAHQFQDRIAVYSRSQSQYQEYSNHFNEYNYEFIATANKQWSQFSLSGNVGGNIRDQQRRITDGITQGGLIVPSYYNLKNAPSVLTNNAFYHKRVYSLFGSFSAGWNDMLYIDGTLRNDWSSTLPISDNSFLYPSVTGSFVFSELPSLRNSNILTFGKIRVGWAQVGNDTDPYQLQQVFEALPAFAGNPNYALSGTLNNALLKPEITSSWETGVNLVFFNNRLSLDATYYDNVSKNQILPVPISAAFGYDAKILNAGRVTNKGVEVTLTGTPIKNDRFEWNSTVNWSTNRNRVDKLDEGVNTLELSNALVTLVAREGQPYGQLLGYDFVYTPDRQRVVQEDGTYLKTSQLVPLGSVLPDYLIGFQNQFRFKKLTFGFLIDGRVGGSFFSQTYKVGMYSGILDRTAANGIRENGVVVDGVKADVTFLPDGTYTTANIRPNDTRISAQDWARNEYNGPTAFSIFDATFFKLREVTLGYQFSLANHIGISSLNVSLYGRNLWNIYTKSKYIDPEFTNSGGNVQGIEGGSIPVPATYGLNVTVNF
ncbi:SusC/RagA family TonB-linked outer membrane protein [Parapedobacter indicus]|uniref:TonB-linked outer membrane protein, SusC/RagA family n=1 Tax=Parapedobacter indicus TaxID=1477437 RepID=A0A1I3H7K4_9SPHI|nr:SusC/RagA family TonB-linked outer membrane protein [Parapedobacter indicus]PPL02923.1 TonB-linked SusC/RagA family outer membrane protein [Parapedobacter indicus]SFI31582.1 TonB-linked outer membrane protein, SusC/RagA family [Parapedobacter indicus]